MAALFLVSYLAARPGSAAVSWRGDPVKCWCSSAQINSFSSRDRSGFSADDSIASGKQLGLVGKFSVKPGEWDRSEEADLMACSPVFRVGHSLPFASGHDIKTCLLWQFLFKLSASLSGNLGRLRIPGTCQLSLQILQSSATDRNTGRYAQSRGLWQTHVYFL